MNKVEMLKVVYKSFNKRNYDMLLSLLHEDIIWKEGVGTDQEITLTGINEIKHHVISQIPMHWDIFEIVPEEYLQANDTVVVLTKYFVKEKLSAKELTTGAAHVWKFKDEKAIELIAYINTVSEVDEHAF
jgi:uncharacterized protein